MDNSSTLACLAESFSSQQILLNSSISWQSFAWSFWKSLFLTSISPYNLILSLWAWSAHRFAWCSWNRWDSNSWLISRKAMSEFLFDSISRFNLSLSLKQFLLSFSRSSDGQVNFPFKELLEILSVVQRMHHVCVSISFPFRLKCKAFVATDSLSNSAPVSWRPERPYKWHALCFQRLEEQWWNSASCCLLAAAGCSWIRQTFWIGESHGGVVWAQEIGVAVGDSDRRVFRIHVGEEVGEFGLITCVWGWVSHSARLTPASGRAWDYAPTSCNGCGGRWGSWWLCRGRGQNTWERTKKNIQEGHHGTTWMWNTVNDARLILPWANVVCPNWKCAEVALWCSNEKNVRVVRIWWSGSVYRTSLQDRSQNGLKHVTNDWQGWFLISSHEWLSSILSCGKHGTALQTGFVSRLRLCWRPWGLKNQPQMVSCVFLKVELLSQSVGCARNKRQVSRSSIESEIISLDVGLRMDGLFALDLWDIVIEVLHSNKDKTQLKHTSHQEQLVRFLIPEPRPNMSQETEGWPIESSGSRTHQDTFFSHKSFSCSFFKTMKPWSNTNY